MASLSSPSDSNLLNVACPSQDARAGDPLCIYGCCHPVIHGIPTQATAAVCSEHGDVAKRLTAMRLLGSDCTATVRELLVAQRALKGVWFQQVSTRHPLLFAGPYCHPQN